MNNREFFNIIVINGKIPNLNAEYIKKLSDSEIYIGNLGKLLINKNELKFIQVMHICIKIMKLYENDTIKINKTIKKIENLLKNYLKFTSFYRVSEVISNISMFLDYTLQSKNTELDDYLNYCKIVRYVSDDNLYYRSKEYHLEHIYTQDGFRLFRIDDDTITPLIVIHKQEIYYIKVDKLRNKEARVNKVISLLKDKDLDLILIPYNEAEDVVLGEKLMSRMF